MSYDLSTLQQMFGYVLQVSFGNMYIAGAVLIVCIAAALYKAGVPGDAAVAIAVPVIIALAGAFLPEWVSVFLIIGLGMLAGLAFYKLLMR
jgi:hypothetical protein